MDSSTKQVAVLFLLMGCVFPSTARPFHASDGPAVPDLLKQILNSIIKEFTARNDAPCQSILDYPQDDITVTTDDTYDTYDELLIMFSGFRETFTSTIGDETRQREKRHGGSKRDNRKRHSRRNKQRQARRKPVYH